MNCMFLHANVILVSFDIVNMFPNIHSKSGLDAGKSVLLKRSTNKPPVVLPMCYLLVATLEKVSIIYHAV